jgi:hypothetical protein
MVWSLHGAVSIHVQAAALTAALELNVSMAGRRIAARRALMPHGEPSRLVLSGAPGPQAS